MAPEQLKREPIDARVDIFAYGVSAYELLTNQKPYPGSTPGEILAAQMQPTGAIPLREHNPDVPAALEKVVMKMPGAGCRPPLPVVRRDAARPAKRALRLTRWRPFRDSWQV